MRGIFFSVSTKNKQMRTKTHAKITEEVLPLKERRDGKERDGRMN
jgi:hypothetical protein